MFLPPSACKRRASNDDDNDDDCKDANDNHDNIHQRVSPPPGDCGRGASTSFASQGQWLTWIIHPYLSSWFSHHQFDLFCIFLKITFIDRANLSRNLWTRVADVNLQISPLPQTHLFTIANITTANILQISPLQISPFLWTLFLGILHVCHISLEVQSLSTALQMWVVQEKTVS